jgi:hypothetical protein
LVLAIPRGGQQGNGQHDSQLGSCCISRVQAHLPWLFGLLEMLLAFCFFLFFVYLLDDTGLKLRTSCLQGRHLPFEPLCQLEMLLLKIIFQVTIFRTGFPQQIDSDEIFKTRQG